MKGCPLRCIWCHNPESQNEAPELYFISEACIHCGNCALRCPKGCHSVTNHQHSINRAACESCGKCADVYVHGALEIKGKPMSVEDVMKVIRLDRSYYESSNGGVTVTGGEPMCQSAFTRALLDQCRREDIHTCLETSGFSSEEKFLALLPVTDLLLFDWKATSAMHKELTGVVQDPIRRNWNCLTQTELP